MPDAMGIRRQIVEHPFATLKITDGEPDAAQFDHDYRDPPAIPRPIPPAPEAGQGRRPVYFPSPLAASEKRPPERSRYSRSR